eukprot:1139324-Pelagomonas_calceolata.AAC.3
MGLLQLLAPQLSIFPACHPLSLTLAPSALLTPQGHQSQAGTFEHVARHASAAPDPALVHVTPIAGTQENAH